MTYYFFGQLEFTERMLHLPSIGISFFLTLGLSMGVDRIQSIIDLVRNDFLDSLTAAWYLDPIFIHFIISILASIMLFFQAKVVVGANIWSRLVASLFPFLLLVIVDIITSQIIKPAFLVPRPPESMLEPPLTAFLREILAYTNAQPDSMPSGFVIRQMCAFLFLAWMLSHYRGKKWKVVLFWIINILALIIVAFSRVYRSAHTALDISVAIGVGTSIFWVIMLSPFYIFSLRGFCIHNIHMSTLIGGTMIILLTVMSYSMNGDRFVQTLAFSIVILGLLFITSPVINISGVKVYRQSTYRRIKRKIT